MFNTEISILLNTENFQYRNFNTIEYRKNYNMKFNSTEIFGIILYVPKIPKCTTFLAKESKKFFFQNCSNFFLEFFRIFGICSVFFVINTKNTEFWDEN